MVSRYRESLKKSKKIKRGEYSGGTPTAASISLFSNGNELKGIRLALILAKNNLEVRLYCGPFARRKRVSHDFAQSRVFRPDYVAAEQCD